MVDRPPVAFDATPPSRAAQQRRTRDALLESAFRVFARDGFHAASLDAIARAAGYSKGAVYSNFASKGELFLAVMDRMLVDVVWQEWDPTARGATREELDEVAAIGFDDPPTRGQLSRGFSLATLEFVSSAGRDERLTAGLRDRIQVLVDAYRRIADERRDDTDPLDDDELAFLLAAFDQGFALFALIGWPIGDVTLRRRGLGRLLGPAPDEAGA